MRDAYRILTTALETAGRRMAKSGLPWWVTVDAKQVLPFAITTVENGERRVSQGEIDEALAEAKRIVPTVRA